MKTVQQEVTYSENTEPVKTVKTTHVTDHTIETPKTYSKKVAIYKTHQVIWYILGIIETILGFRVILKLMAANPVSPFTAFVYDVSYPFAYPFFGMVNSPVAANGFVFEWSTLIGMLVYAALAYGLVYTLQLIKPISPLEVEEAVDNV